VGDIHDVGLRLTAEETTVVGDAGLAGTDNEGGGVVNRRSLGMASSIAASWKRTNASRSTREALKEQYLLHPKGVKTCTY
jgi:hypothetical protein